MMTSPTPELALRLIHENLEQKAPFLDLGNCGLTCLPRELAELKHLKALNFGQQFLRYTESEASSDTTLKLSSFSDFDLLDTANKGEPNHLTADEISRLGKYLNLKQLYLTHLQLSDIGGLNNFEYLEVLYLGNNDLRDISALPKVSKIKILDLKQNQISNISPLSAYEELTILNLSQNKINDLVPLSRLEKLSTIFLHENQLFDLDPLKSLINLKQLVLAKNFIVSITALKSLNKLEKLDLSFNQINKIEELISLNQLEDLSISSNKIENLSSVSSLNKLIRLSADTNLLKYLPKEPNWPKLNLLYLDNNKLGNVSSLANLKELNVLSLSNNKIQSLPNLQSLELQTIDLSGNLIDEVSTLVYLKKFEYLRSLDLRNNKISFIEPLAIGFRKEVALKISENPLKDIPLELTLSNNVEEVSTYFKSLIKEDAINSAEVKIILVGNSTAGKTSLARVLRAKPFQSTETSTHGIQIHQWKVFRRDFPDGELEPDTPEVITVNIWDFGGQEYYHGTHQLFLDNNAIYLLVWEQELEYCGPLETPYPVQGSENQKVLVPVEHFSCQYWLDSIRFYAHAEGDNLPPIFMVQNKLDNKGGLISWPDPVLLQKYKVAEVIALSAMLARSKKPAEREYHHRFQIFRDKLLRAVRQKAMQNLGRDRLPASWQRIRESIQEATDKDSSKKALAKNPFALKVDENQSLDGVTFRLACQEVIAPATLNIAQLETLVRYLNSVGAVYGNQADEDRIYLVPTLLTKKIYQILNQEVLRRKGRFTEAEAQGALGLAQDKYVASLIKIMERWDIIFPAPLPKEPPRSALLPAEHLMPSTPQSEWIATQYLPDEHPLEGLYQIAASGLEQNYFIVRSPLFHFKKALRQLVFSIGKGPNVRNKEFWKNGILFTTVDGSLRVLIKGDWVNGETTGKILVYVEHRPGSEAQTAQWEGEIFDQIIGAMTDNSGQQSAGTIAQIGQTNLAETYLRRMEKSKDLQVSRNGTDFVRVIDLVQQAQKEVIQVASSNPNGSAGKILNVSDFAPFLRAFGQKPPKPSLFMSYSHNDAALRDELEIFLGPIIKRLKLTDAWHDGQIEAGDHWDERIKSKLEKADIVLLLISASFINSDYSWEKEMLPALGRYQRGEARVIPILLSDCLWQDLPFAELEMIPKEPQNSRLLAITQWTDRAKAFTTVAKRIQEVLKEMKI